jgi:putative transposase
MKRSRFTDSQILSVLTQAEAGTAVPYLCCEHGISSATFCKWGSKYGGMDVSLITRMKELEEENRRMKKLDLEAQIKPTSSRRPSQKARRPSADARWPGGQSRKKAGAFVWRTRRLVRVRADIAMSRRLMPRTPSFPSAAVPWVELAIVRVLETLYNTLRMSDLAMAGYLPR